MQNSHHHEPTNLGTAMISDVVLEQVMQSNRIVADAQRTLEEARKFQRQMAIEFARFEELHHDILFKH